MTKLRKTVSRYAKLTFFANLVSNVHVLVTQNLANLDSGGGVWWRGGIVTVVYLMSRQSLICAALYCFALHCIALHCIALSCLVLSCLVGPPPIGA